MVFEKIKNKIMGKNNDKTLEENVEETIEKTYEQKLEKMKPLKFENIHSTSQKTGDYAVIGMYSSANIDGYYFSGEHQLEGIFFCPPNTELYKATVFFNVNPKNVGKHDWHGTEKLLELIQSYIAEDKVVAYNGEVSFLSPVKHCWTAGGYVPLEGQGHGIGGIQFKDQKPSKGISRVWYVSPERLGYETAVKNLIEQAKELHKKEVKK